MHNKNKSTDGVSRLPARSNIPVAKRDNKLTSLAWFAMLIVVGSIAFSSYMVYFGTTDLIAKLLITPQIAFAGGVLLYKFVK